MNETDARHILLVRAFEDPPVPPWSTADAAWANEAGARAAGEEAPDTTWLVQRAHVAHHRLAEREPALRRVEAAFAWPAGIGLALAGVGFGIGLAGDALGSSQRINILAPPLLALLAWNLGVYLLMAVTSALRSRGAQRAGPLREGALRLLRPLARVALRRATDAGQPALMRFAGDWSNALRPLMLARLQAPLHAAAAALAAGALVSLYLRGLAFEYQAGWESTFLGPAAVHALISAVLGPAAALSGIALPGAEQLAQLRFPASAGENAARWIHLYALTLLLVIVLPRSLLASHAARQARRLARHFPLSLDEPYFKRLLRGRSVEPLQVSVLPFSYQVPAALLPGIGAALQSEFGGRLSLTLVPGAIEGSGDGDDDAPLPDITAGDGPIVALFPLTATPEREVHGRFLDALASRWPGRISVLIDESGFRRRFGGADGSNRLAQRREAWLRLLREHGQQARFADLSGDLRT